MGNYFKHYYIENKDTIPKRLSVNQKRGYKEDLEFKLLKRIQAKIINELPDYDGTVENFVGCSLSFVLKWIKFNTFKFSDWEHIHLHHVRLISTYTNNHHHAFDWINLLPIDKHTNLLIKKQETNMKKNNK